MNNPHPVTLDALISLCKRRGFVYPSSDIYGGLNGVYDYGPLGTLLKQNIRTAWIDSLKKTAHTILFLEGAILGPPALWEASGHVENFHDPMVDCMTCKHRYRADDIDITRSCPHCGNKTWTAVRQFNMMFRTELGAVTGHQSIAYLRPETAQAIFVNFKNVISTNRVKIPFGIAQIGKAFRNEITPKQFLFRMREFEQMEIEWFCKPSDAALYFKEWVRLRTDFYTHLGISADKIRTRAHESTELAHYSTACTDIEYEFPFGWKEIEGIAHRGSFDLEQHIKASGKDSTVYDDEEKKSYIPMVIESSVGVDRLFLTLLCDAYMQDTVEGEARVVLRFTPRIAPIKAAFLPLTKVLGEPMHTLYTDVMKATGYSVEYDETGSIGKRYRRYDEIGTPFCFTYDYESAQDCCVTVRDRDNLTQERISLDSVIEYLRRTCQ
jgi:glycyl-tRNA synthetase